MLEERLTLSVSTQGIVLLTTYKRKSPIRSVEHFSEKVRWLA